MTAELKKKQKLRNNEYYNTQEMFDNLFEKSKRNYHFKDLLKFIISEENILLAYRNIKKNKGSKTKGINNNTIIDIGNKKPEILIKYVRNRLSNYVV